MRTGRVMWCKQEVACSRCQESDVVVVTLQSTAVVAGGGGAGVLTACVFNAWWAQANVIIAVVFLIDSIGYGLCQLAYTADAVLQ